jgi:hypothetical protein
MPHVYEPRLTPVEIKTLRPTQMTIGMGEVDMKRRRWLDIRKEKGDDFLGRHMVPVVIGPKERLFLVDHHHLVRALHEEGVAHVLTSVVADLSHLGKEEFWSVMDHRNLIYPFDREGRRRSPVKIPKRIEHLEDDPFRSLAGAVRMAGGFAKVAVPFSEFAWADFLRRRLDLHLVTDSFGHALSQAMILARSDKARHLPGWCGEQE